MGVALSTQSAASADWAQMGHDSSHTSYNSAETTLSAATIGNLVDRFAIHFDTVGSGAAVVGDYLYVGANNQVFKYSLAGEGPIWQTSVGADYSVFGTPAVGKGVVYVVAAPTDGTGLSKLLAIRVGTGGVKWSKDLAGYASGSPTIGDGSIYTVDNNAGTLHVSKFSSSSGNLAWQISVPATGGDPSAVGASVSGGRVFIQLGKNVHAYNAVDGTPLWSTNYVGGGPSAATPVVDNGVLYFANSTEVVALKAATGKKRWTAVVDPNGTLGPLSLDPEADQLFVLDYVNGGFSQLVSLDTVGGAPMWSTEVVGGTGRVSIANELVYVGQSTATGQGLGVFAESTGEPARDPYTLAGDWSPIELAVSSGRVVATQTGGVAYLTVLDVGT